MAKRKLMKTDDYPPAYRAIAEKAMLIPGYMVPVENSTLRNATRVQIHMFLAAVRREAEVWNKTLSHPGHSIPWFVEMARFFKMIIIRDSHQGITFISRDTTAVSMLLAANCADMLAESDRPTSEAIAKGEADSASTARMMTFEEGVQLLMDPKHPAIGVNAILATSFDGCTSENVIDEAVARGWKVWSKTER